MVVSGPKPQWCDDTCGVCPAQVLGPGSFDVVERPDRRYAYDPAVGWRVDPAGVAICVHPYRVGLPPGRYASAGEALPDHADPVPGPDPQALILPDSIDDLEGWLVARLRTASDAQIFAAVAAAEREAATRFDPAQVVTALRRVLSHELARR